MKFLYYEKDGATFRQPEGARGVSHVKVDGEWHEYTGDRIAPIKFGDQITAKEAGEAADTEALTEQRHAAE